MYIHSMKNINFKNVFTLNFFFEFNVEQIINQLITFYDELNSSVYSYAELLHVHTLNEKY